MPVTVGNDKTTLIVVQIVKRRIFKEWDSKSGIDSGQGDYAGEDKRKDPNYAEKNATLCFNKTHELEFKKYAE